MGKKLTLSFTLTAALITLQMIYLNFTPFGNSSFAIYDAEIQYMDFFAYLKHVLAGEASVTFSFDKGLGGNMWLVMTYYLMSPFNLLIVFFEQDELHTFYNLLIVLKLSLSAATMTYYLEKRFDGKLGNWVVTLISLGFGLMQYNMDQAMNIMWLDPVYMFPLMMLGLYKLRKNGDIKLLVISSALAMLFNWYIALIAMMFVGMFSVWEYIFLNDTKSFIWRDFLIFEGKVLLSIALAVGLNGLLFFPTLEVLSVGRGTVDWGSLDLTLYKKALNIFQGLSWGSLSGPNHVCLFTGDLVTFGAVAFFLQKNINRRLLIGGMILVIFTWLMFYWRPLLFLFSLLKAALVYWYRYGFLGNFILIYLASLFFVHRVDCSEWRFQTHKLHLIAFAVYPGIVIARHFSNPVNFLGNVLGSLAVYSITVTFFCLRDSLKENSAKIFRVVLTIMLVFGISFSSGQIMNRYSTNHAERFKIYVDQQIQQIQELKQFDDSIFRIGQSRPYNNLEFEDKYKKIYSIVNYNEGLAYNYHSITTYTSSPINAQQELLDHLGYKSILQCMNCATVSVLPVDSLLGVKYILSDIDVVGLTPINELHIYNDKSTYENKFAMPLAFVCNDFNLDDIQYNDNPFNYTNEIYSRLFGLNDKIYQNIPYRVLISNSKNVEIELQTKSISSALYGNLPTENNETIVTVIDETPLYLLNHRTSVFYIPTSSKDKVDLNFYNEEGKEFHFSDFQFCMLNEAALYRASEQARLRAAHLDKFTDHEIKMTIQGKAGEKLFTTIPYEGWQVTLNGKPVRSEVILGCFVGLTLEEGENIIEMNYSMPGLALGCTISVLSFILFIFCLRRFDHETRII